jgi:kynurenine 3-monooxygenase
LSALVLNSLFYPSDYFKQFHIQLYDEQPFPPPLPTDASVWGSTNLDRYYLIGLGGRGITSLRQFGVWEEVKEVAVPVPGRKDWNGKGPNTQPVETFKTERKFVTQVLPRDKLVSVLYHHIINGQSQAKQQSAEDANVAPSYPNVVVNYGFQVKPVDIDCSDGKVIVCASDIRSVENTSNKYLSASLVIAADGSARTFANAIQEHDSTQRTDDSDALRVVRYEDDNQKVFKNIAFRIPEQWRNDMNYAVRTGRVIFDALPANDQRDYVGVLLLSKDDGMARPNVDAKAFHEFLKDEIPQFVNFLDFTTITKVAKRAPSPLPMFRYVTPRMHHGDGRIVLLGDCAHTVKPYFGMGANSALEDVKLLSDCIDERRGSKSNSAIDETETLKLAVRGFSMTRSPDIETLVKVSHSLDRPGAAGIVSFLIPIILDGIFSKILPDFFAPNIISMLQNEEVTFQQAAARKRLDRFGQVVVLTVAVASIQNILGFVLQQP